ncbi:hypothetical protein [Actinoplanes sp. NPDC020271]|uniref:hypothetical protein n=1 Tax=Actinoplanes sp. NPDC020271 TaxID=3363896 RepID=UPI00379AE852
MQFPGLVGVEQTDADQVERADEPVREPEAAGPRDRVAQRHRPVVLDHDQRGRAVVRDLREHVPGLRVLEDGDLALGVGGRGTERGTGLHALLALDAQADQGTDLAAQFDGLVVGQVAQVLHLHSALLVLVDGERVDHAYRVGLPQPFQLGDHLTVEVRVPETEHDQLDGSDGHLLPFRFLRS